MVALRHVWRLIHLRHGLLLLGFIFSPIAGSTSDNPVIKPSCTATGIRFCVPILESQQNEVYRWGGKYGNKIPLCEGTVETIAAGGLQRCMAAPFSAQVDGTQIANPCGSNVTQSSGRNNVITVHNTVAADGILFGAVANEYDVSCFYLGTYDKELNVLLDNEVEIVLNQLTGEPEHSFDFNGYECADAAGEAKMNCAGTLRKGELQMRACDESEFILPETSAATGYPGFSLVIAVEVTQFNEDTPQPLLWYSPADGTVGFSLLDAVTPAMVNTEDTRCPPTTTDSTVCAGGLDVSKPTALYLLYNETDGMVVYSSSGEPTSFTDPNIRPHLKPGDRIVLKDVRKARGCQNIDSKRPNVIYVAPYGSENEIYTSVVVTFDELLKIGQGGSIVISSEADHVKDVLVRIDASMIDGSTLTVSLLPVLIHDTAYSVSLFQGSVLDKAGNPNSKMSWTFATKGGPVDDTPPVLKNGKVEQEGVYPRDLYPEPTLYFDWDEPIEAGQGNILLVFSNDNDDNPIINPISFDIHDAVEKGWVTIAGSVFLIHPPFTFPENNRVDIWFAPGIVTDLAGNPSAEKFFGGLFTAPHHGTGDCSVAHFSNKTCGEGASDTPVECQNKRCCWVPADDAGSAHTCVLSPSVDYDAALEVELLLPQNEADNLPLSLSGLVMRFNKRVAVLPSAGDVILTPSSHAASVHPIRINTHASVSVLENEVHFVLPTNAAISPNQHYNVHIPYGLLQDFIGNFFDFTEHVWSFTFGPDNSKDTMRPYALPHAAIPKAGSKITLPDLRTIVVPFSEPIRLGRGFVLLSSNEGPAYRQFVRLDNSDDSSLIRVLGDKNLLLIQALKPFPENSQIQVILSAGLVTDNVGNPSSPLGPEEYSFRVKIRNSTPAPLDRLPQEIAFFPKRGSTKVPLLTTMSVLFNQPIESGAGTIHVQPVSKTSTVKGLTLHVIDDGTNNKDDGHVETFENVLRLTLAVPLEPKELYTIVIPGGAVASLRGNDIYSGLEAEDWSFTTLDDPQTPPTAPLTPFFTVPADDQTDVQTFDRLSIHFDRKISVTRPRDDNTGFSKTNFSLHCTLKPSAGGGEATHILLQDTVIVNSHTYENNNGFLAGSVLFRIHPPLSPEQLYTVTIPEKAFTSSEDSTSPPVQSAAISFSFRTGKSVDTEAPRVIQEYNVELVGGLTDLPFDAPLFVAFPENVFVHDQNMKFEYRPADGIIKNIRLDDSEQIVLLGSVILFTPIDPPIPDENKQVTIEFPAGILRDAAGNTNEGQRIRYKVSRFLINKDGEGDPLVDFTAPDVQNVNDLPMVIPPQNAINVPLQVTLVVMFNEKIDINSGYIMVVAVSGDHFISVPLTDSKRVKKSQADLVILVELQELLRKNTTYNVVLGSGNIRDKAGIPFNGMGSGENTFHWKFDTGSPNVHDVDFKVAADVKVFPDNSGVAIPFTEKVLPNQGCISFIPLRRTDGSHPIRKNPINVDVVRIPSYLGDAIIVKFDRFLEADTVYAVYAPSGTLRNVQGEAAPKLDFEITTFTGVNYDIFPISTSLNQFGNVYPLHNAINVPIDTALIIRFTEELHVFPKVAKLFLHVTSFDKTSSKVVQVNLDDSQQAIIRDKELYIFPPKELWGDSVVKVLLAEGSLYDPVLNFVSPDNCDAHSIDGEDNMVLLDEWTFHTGLKPKNGVSNTLENLFGLQNALDVGFFPKLPLEPPLNQENEYPESPFCLILPPLDIDLAKRNGLLKSDKPSSLSINCTIDFLAFDSTATLFVQGNLIQVCPPRALPQNRLCTLKVSERAVVDQYGNENKELHLEFLTPFKKDKAPPLIEYTHPVAEKPDQPLNSLIIASFSESISLSPNASKHYMKLQLLIEGEDRSTWMLPITRQDIEGRSLIVRTPRNLLEECEVTVTIPEKAVADLAGNLLASDYTWKFNTGTKATSTASKPPQLACTYPNGITLTEATNKGGVPVIMAFFEPVGYSGPVTNRYFDVSSEHEEFQSNEYISYHKPSGPRVVITRLPPLLDENANYTVEAFGEGITSRDGVEIDTASKYLWFLTPTGVRSSESNPLVQISQVEPQHGSSWKTTDVTLILSFDFPVVVGPRNDNNTITKVFIHRSDDPNSKPIYIPIHNTSACLYGKPSTLVRCRVPVTLEPEKEYNVWVGEAAFTGIRNKLPNKALANDSWIFTTGPEPPAPGDPTRQGAETDFDGFHFYNRTLSGDDLPDPELLYVEARGRFTLSLKFCKDSRCSDTGAVAPYQYPDTARKYYYGLDVTAQGYFPYFRHCIATPTPIDPDYDPPEYELNLTREGCPLSPNRAAWTQDLAEMKAYGSTHSFSFAGYTTVYLSCETMIVLEAWNPDQECVRTVNRRNLRSLTVNGQWRRAEANQQDGSVGLSRELRMGPFFSPEFESAVLPIGAGGAALAPIASTEKVKEEATEVSGDKEAFWWWWILLIILLLVLFLVVLLLLWYCFKCRVKKEVDHAEEESPALVNSQKKGTMKIGLVAQGTIDAMDDALSGGSETMQDKTRKATIAKEASQQQSLMEDQDGEEYQEQDEEEDDAAELIAAGGPKKNAGITNFCEDQNLPLIGGSSSGGGHKFSGSELEYNPVRSIQVFSAKHDTLIEEEDDSFFSR